MSKHSVSCHICGATFPDSAALLSHMIVAHKI
jgi:hypothetical protein